MMRASSPLGTVGYPVNNYGHIEHSLCHGSRKEEHLTITEGLFFLFLIVTICCDTSSDLSH